MSAAFEKWFAQLQVEEGGWVNDPDDTGGETYRGVTKKRAEQVLGRPLTTEELIHEVDNNGLHRRIAKSDWDFVRAGELPPAVGIVAADLAWHAGPDDAGRVVQRGLRNFGFNLNTDEVIGGRTIEVARKAVDAFGAANVGMALFSAIGERHLRHVEVTPEDQKFIRGWMARAERMAYLGAQVNGATEKDWDAAIDALNPFSEDEDQREVVPPIPEPRASGTL